MYGKYVNRSMRFPIDLNKNFELRSHDSHMHDVEHVVKEQINFKNIAQSQKRKILSHRGVKSLDLKL